jgi:translation initiation factor RLI1
MAEGKKVAGEEEAQKKLLKKVNYSYPSMTKTLGAFKLTVHEGIFSDS